MAAEKIMVISVRSANTAWESHLLIHTPHPHHHPMQSVRGSFLFFVNEIYRTVKIGLWVWFITTKISDWIPLPPCPWSSQESFTWHPGTSHSISAFLSVFMVLWCRANSSQFLKSTLLYYEMGLQRGHKGGSFCLTGCYYILLHF